RFHNHTAKTNNNTPKRTSFGACRFGQVTIGNGG
ncbi:unnamed protein product, partial [marine sediment metagenome]